jgi:hypothetical protein
MKLKGVLALVLMCAMLTTACSTAWVSTLDSILVAAAPALINILQIVAVANGEPVNANLVAKINADTATIKTLATDFANASSTAGPGVCAQLQAAIATYQADELQVLQVAHVTDQQTQTKITLLSTLVSGTVQAILAVIPECKAQAATTFSGHSFQGAPALNLKNFITTYNSILKAPTGRAGVDALTPKLVLHQHSKFWRVASLGRLN